MNAIQVNTPQGKLTLDADKITAILELTDDSLRGVNTQIFTKSDPDGWNSIDLYKNVLAKAEAAWSKPCL